MCKICLFAVVQMQKAEAATKNIFYALYEKGKFMVSKMVISVCYIESVKDITTIENTNAGFGFK